MAYKSELGDITKYVTVDNIVHLLIKLKSVDGGFIASDNYIGGFKTGFVGANTCRGVKLTEGHQAYVELWPEQKGGNVGAGNQPVYFKDGVPEPIVITAGTTTKPVYFKDGVITECEDIGQMLKNILDPSVKNIKFNQTHKRLEIKTDIKTTDEAEPEEATFVTEALTKLEKPDAPYIGTTTYNVVRGNAQVSVQNTFKFAATLYYRIKTNGATEWGAWNDLGSTASTASKSFNIASGYADTTSNNQIVKNVQVKAVYKGEESDVANFDITIKPKVASGSISVSADGYGTTLKVTVNLSATTGATNEYSLNGGAWTKFTKATLIIEESTDESVPETHKLNVKVRATKTNYVAADQASNTSSYTIGQRKVYYGFSTKSALANITDIKALKDSGGSLPATTIEKNKAYSIDPDGFKNTSPYIWICMTGTIDPDFIFANAASVIPMGFNKAIQVGGWNCYRLTSTVTDLTGNTTFVLK